MSSQHRYRVAQMRIRVNEAGDDYRVLHSYGSSTSETLVIKVELLGKLRYPDAIAKLDAFLSRTRTPWLVRHDDAYLLDLPVVLGLDSTLGGPEWATSWALATAEVETELHGDAFLARGTFYTTDFIFSIDREHALKFERQRIFLSHKGADKSRVRGFAELLREIGFDPWLDEDAMPAGTQPNRGISHGFQQSCAAVFFVTPSFLDKGYLSTEIDYAVAEYQRRDGQFTIITLVLRDNPDESVTIPVLLQNYIWKEPMMLRQAPRDRPETMI